MEFGIKKTDLLRGLYPAQSIADRKSTMAQVGNVLLRTDGKEKILCAATNLTVSVAAELPASVTKEGGITVSARVLFDIVKALPTEELTFERQDNQRIVIRAGRAQYKLVGTPDRDYPRLPSHKEITASKIAAPALRDRIAKTIFSTLADETRYHLSGVHFECDGKRARMASTDGHRFSKVEWEFAGGPELPQGVIIPRKGLGEMLRTLESETGNAEIGIAQGHFFLRMGPLALATKLADAQFPPYDKVIPTAHTLDVVVDRQLFLAALQRISIVASDRTYGIKLQVSADTLIVQSDNPDLGEAREELEATVKGDKPELVIGFNARYLVDVLGQIEDDKVVLELGGALEPGVVRPAGTSVAASGKGAKASAAKVDYLGVIMPMRV